MARSHWIIGACPALLAVIVAACGGGDDAADTDNDTTPDASITPAPVDAGSDATPEASTPPITDAPLDPDAVGTVTETSINFGSVNCGTTAAPRTFAINNPSTKGSMRFEVILNKGDASPFVISPASGTIQPGQKALITVTPYTIPRGTAQNPTTTVANGQGDAVTVVAGTANLEVDLVQRANGAILNFGTEGIDFKSSPIANTASPIIQSYSVQNSGSVAANLTMTIGGTGPFGLGDSVANKTATLAANIGNATGSAIFRPTTATTFNGTVAMALANDVPLCADLPEALTLRGRGVNSNIQLSQGQLDFGLTPCGTTATLKTFTLTNLGNNPIKITSLSVTTGSAYYTTSVTPGVNTLLANNASATITVTPRTIAPSGSLSFDPNFYKGVLSIVTRDDTAGTDSTDTVDLLQTMQGAFLTRTPASISFGQQGRGSVSTITQNYVNTGNQDIVLDLSKANNVPQFTLDKAQVVLPKGGTVVPLNISFSPTADPGVSDVINVAKTAATANVPWCQQSTTVAGTNVSGSGRTSYIAAVPGTLDFSAVNCGTTADAKTITLTNNGPAGRFVANLKFGTQFTLNGAAGDGTITGNIGSLASMTFTITPKAVPTTVTGMGAITDVLQFNVYDDANTVITAGVPNVSITPKGAFIQWFRDDNKGGISSWGFGNVKTNTGNVTIAADIRNAGTVNTNATFQVLFKDGSSPMFSTAPSPTTFVDLAQNTYAPFSFSFKPVAAAGTAGAQTGTLYVQSLTDGVPVCNTQTTVALTGTGN